MNPTQPNQKNIVQGNITAGGNVIIGDTTYINNYFAAQEVKIPHRLTNNIPTNADHILGRATELAQAHDHLAQHQATVLFNGIGGIGKTALASKYMAVYGAEYKHLAWITVQSTLAEAFTNNAPLLASLQITQQVQDYIAAKQLDKAFEYLFHQLNLLERTLVVIDNANDLDDLDQYKNWFDTAHCHFLITSRSQPSEWATVEVDSLPEDEAVRLFRKLHPSVSADDEAIKSLLSKLFYHTLLIELVAKAGASTGIPFADLQTMIETQFIHHQSLNEAPIPTGKHGSVVATNLKKAKIEDYIWLIFSQVKGLDEGSKHLLKAMALLPVATPFDLEFLKAHFSFFNISDAVVHLDALIERGWLQKEQMEGQKPYFKMHPLIGDVVVEHLEVDIEFAEAFIKIIAIGINFDSTNTQHNLFVVNKKKLFAERLSNLFFHENSVGLEELLGFLGSIEENYGFYNKAAYYKERALQIVETIYEKNHPMISVRQNNLGWTYHYLGKYNQAIELLETALANDIKTFGKDHPLVARVLSNLSVVYGHLGRYDEAAGLLEIVLENNLRIFGQDDPSIARTQSNLATIYDHLGRHNEAADLLEAALASNLNNFDKDHPAIATAQSNLANVYLKFGLCHEAATLLEVALSSNLKNFGKNHPEVAISQGNLAMVYKDLEQYDKATELLETALESDLKNLGKDHPSIAVSQSNLALIYGDLGRYDQAIDLLEIALSSDLKNFGENHPDVAVSQNNLAILYKNVGKDAEAKILWRAAYNPLFDDIFAMG
jgi:tetratricopeptide (TPR) repeat protein